MQDQRRIRMNDSENIPGTWAYELKRHWYAFNECVRCMDDSKGKVAHIKWREDILYDMLRRHNEEVKNDSMASRGPADQFPETEPKESPPDQ